MFLSNPNQPNQSYHNVNHVSLHVSSKCDMGLIRYISIGIFPTEMYEAHIFPANYVAYPRPCSR